MIFLFLLDCSQVQQAAVLLSVFFLSDVPGVLYGVACQQAMGWLAVGWPALLVIAKQVCIWWKWRNLRAIILLQIPLFKFTVCAQLGYFCYGNLMKSSYRKIHARKCCNSFHLLDLLWVQRWQYESQVWKFENSRRNFRKSGFFFFFFYQVEKAWPGVRQSRVSCSHRPVQEPTFI